ncbi:hypothetical protein BJV77DRAFT_1053326 [Russula vinacea]|nr:hypothetical protein BJV77DRAFT_1053326 [Russula vinacea]
MYDAMKEKRQLKTLLDGQQQDAELAELYTYISTHKPASAPSVDELKGETQSAVGKTEVAKRDYMTSSVESPISRIFGGRSRLTAHVPRQPDAVTAEDWRLLRLDIQPDSVHTIQDALAHVSRPQPVRVSQSSSSEASQQVHIEVFPSVLVLRLKRLVYNAAADGIVEINKPVQFMPELEIPTGTIFSFFPPVLANAKNAPWLGRSRNHGTDGQKIYGAPTLQALWGALPPRRVRQWRRALYCRRAPPERRERWW